MFKIMVAEYEELLDACSCELQAIEKRINKNKLDQMVKYLQNYAVIRACGTIENVVKNIIADSVTVNASFEIQNYIQIKIRDSSSNPKTTIISSILGEFSTEWKKSFDNKLTNIPANSDNNKAKTELNSLVQLRNDFAHGKSVGIGISSIRKYFDSACEIVKIVDGIVGNNIS